MKQTIDDFVGQVMEGTKDIAESVEFEVGIIADKKNGLIVSEYSQNKIRFKVKRK